MFILLPGFLAAGLVVSWYHFKVEDEETEEYETFLKFYKARLCCCYGWDIGANMSSLDLVSPLLAQDPLDQAQFIIKTENLFLGDRIGAGGCGWVYEGTLGGSGSPIRIACKEVMTARIDPDDLEEFHHEARMVS